MLPGWQFVSREVIMNENSRNETVRGEAGRGTREGCGINKVFKKYKGAERAEQTKKGNRKDADSGEGKTQAENVNERGEDHGNDCRYYNYH